MLVDLCDGPTNGEDMVDMPRVDAKVMDHSQEVHDSFNGESVSSFSYKVHNGGSILDILDDMVPGWTFYGSIIWMVVLKDRYGIIGYKEMKIWRVLIRWWSYAWLSFSHSDSNAMVQDLEMGNVSDDILLNRMELNRRLQDIKLLEVKDLVQKSKIKWAIEGDENSKFFHGSISARVMIVSNFNALFIIGFLRIRWMSWNRAVVSRDEIRRDVGTVARIDYWPPMAANRIGFAVLKARIFVTWCDGWGVYVSEVGLGCAWWTNSKPYLNGSLDMSLASKLNGGLGCLEVLFTLNRAFLLNWKFFEDSGFDFSSHCKKRIGDGSCTSFWYDIWLADAPLCVQFPRLFALELDKEIVVANKMGASSVSASFRRDVRDGAQRQQWDDLSSILHSVVLSSSKDRWTCDLSGDGEFKVKVIRNFIDDLFLPSSDVKTRWVKFIPIKVNVFSWRARRDRLPTRVNLSRRGVLLDFHLCPLCNAAMEDVQHVFFRRDVARVVLRKICRWWDLNWQEICSFSDWDAWFLSFRLSSRLKSILEGVFYVAWWRIWRLRNQLVFDASPPNRSTIFDDIVSWSFLWLG
ncbi:RNA-directed DNA polymerase, eukaryota [Tanacetum coccineum]